MSILEAARIGLARPGQMVRAWSGMSGVIGAGPALRVKSVNYVAKHSFRLGLRPDFRPLSVRVPWLRHPVLLRPGTSDPFTFKQIFQERVFAPLDGTDRPRAIVDCGANVGYASAYFLSRFPEARVLALEPDPGNAELCRRNLAPYGGRAQVLERAVWPRTARLVLLRYGTRGAEAEDAIQVCEPDALRDEAADALRTYVHAGAHAPVPSGEVEAIGMADLLRMAGDQQVDILKIDIEKAELELFKEPEIDWLPRVRNIAIELHGEEARRRFFLAMRRFEFDAVESQDMTICRGIRPRYGA